MTLLFMTRNADTTPTAAIAAAAIPTMSKKLKPPWFAFVVGVGVGVGVPVTETVGLGVSVGAADGVSEGAVVGVAVGAGVGVGVGVGTDTISVKSLLAKYDHVLLVTCTFQRYVPLDEKT